MTAPKLRLAGFKEPWNSGVVSRLLVERKELAPQSKQYPLMAFVAYKGVASKGDRYDRSSLVKDIAGKLYKRTEKGDFIYSSNNLETGSIGLNKYGKACISPVYGIFCPTCDSDSEYIGVALCRKKFIQEMVKWRQGVVYGQWRIHEDDFLGIPVPFPGGDEQRAMGRYFASLDRLIDAEVLRLESLRKLKVACLEKMFVHDGEKCPRLRLGGFRGDWEKICLGDIGVYSGGKGYSKSSLKPRGNPIVLYGRLYTQYETTIKDVKTFADLLPNSVLSNGGEVVVPTSGEEAADIAVAAVIKNPGVIIGGGLTVITLNKRYDSVFVALVITYGSAHHALAKVAQGKTIVHLYADELKKVSVYVPPTLEEQQMISEFFVGIDRAMHLATSRLEKIGHLKSACMERMFV